MKKQFIFLLILIVPFAGMITINEIVRYSIDEEGYNKQGVHAINSAKRLTNKCSWMCHNDTNYCKENHVKLVRPYFDKLDPIYFGIIYSLRSTGNYALANLIVFVFLGPLMIFTLLVKSINMELEIRKIENS